MSQPFISDLPYVIPMRFFEYIHTFRSTCGEGRGQGRRGGFTLIELLAVIAIIAILAALLFPALGRVTTKVRIAACLQNLRSMSSAFTLYAADYEGRIPTYGIQRTDQVPNLSSYLSSKSISKSPWLCPDDRMTRARADLIANPDDKDLYYSYGCVFSFLPKRATDELDSPYFNTNFYYSILTADVQRPSSAVFLADGGYYWIVNNSISFKHQSVQFRHGRPTDMEVDQSNATSVPGGGWAARGYDTKGEFKTAKANVLYHDGHAASLTYENYCTHLNFYTTNRFTDRSISKIPDSEYR